MSSTILNTIHKIDGLQYNTRKHPETWLFKNISYSDR